MVNLSTRENRITHYKRDGGVEGGYNELVSGRGWFASPAALATLATALSSRSRGSIQVLANLYGACLIGCAVSISAQAAPSLPTCPEMLMDFECAAYRQRIAQAGNNAQRERIVNEYALIVKERHRLCPVPRESGLHAAKLSYRKNP